MTPQRLVLEVEGGPGGIELPRAGVLTLGSKEGRADVVVHAEGVADVHCAIGRVKGKDLWALKDLGAPAGTRVNGKPVASAKLAAGDTIQLGAARVRVVDTASPPQKAAKPQPPAAREGGDSSAAQELTHTTVRAVREVQGYAIEKPLGRGGMGQVFLAVQESLQRKVALKVLSERFSADQDFVARFQAEARAAAALNHPNVVTVHDVWEEKGRHFLSMEYMDQGNLEGKLARSGRLSAAETLDILSDAAKGLVFAELRGIVHRDIKPANLMINEVGTIKIADLGLATHLEAEATEDSGGKIFGTPHFISPEQARGERVDGRSDLYSLGATAYRLLSGRTPFEGASTREILRGHFNDAPTPLEQLAPELPAGLCSLVAKLLEKKPEDRFASAGSLLQEIERLKSQLVLGVAQPTGETQAAGRKWVLPAAGLVLVGGAAAAWFLMGGGDGAQDQNVHAADPAGPEASEETANGVPSGEVLAVSNGEVGAAGTDEPPSDDDSALERLELDAQRAYDELSQALDPAARATALRNLASEFAGTTQAGSFSIEAESIDSKIVEASKIAVESSARLSGALSALESAASLEDPERSLDAALESLANVQYDARLDQNAAFQEQRLGVWRKTISAASERAAGALLEADRLAADGAFEEQAELLVSALEMLGEGRWPELPEAFAATSKTELDGVQAAAAELRARLASQHLERHAWNLERLRRDRTAETEALGGPTGFERELASLDMAAATQRLAGLESALDEATAAARVRTWIEDLSAAQAAMDALVTAWKQDSWKRTTLRDPRRRGRSNREAIGADARGILISADGGSELLPWAAFGRSPADLQQLFYERLTRTYDPREMRGIAVLLRNAAVLSSLAECEDVLRGSSRGVLSPGEARTLLDGFELARPWAAGAEQMPALERELDAARTLRSALEAFGDARWAAAETELARLLVEHRDSLLVQLLSDGRALGALDERMVPPVAHPLDVPPPASQESPRDAGSESQGGAAGDSSGAAPGGASDEGR